MPETIIRRTPEEEARIAMVIDHFDKSNVIGIVSDIVSTSKRAWLKDFMHVKWSVLRKQTEVVGVGWKFFWRPQDGWAMGFDVRVTHQGFLDVQSAGLLNREQIQLGNKEQASLERAKLTEMLQDAYDHPMFISV